MRVLQHNIQQLFSIVKHYEKKHPQHAGNGNTPHHHDSCSSSSASHNSNGSDGISNLHPLLPPKIHELKKQLELLCDGEGYIERKWFPVRGHISGKLWDGWNECRYTKHLLDQQPVSNRFKYYDSVQCNTLSGATIVSMMTSICEYHEQHGITVETSDLAYWLHTRVFQQERDKKECRKIVQSLTAYAIHQSFLDQHDIINVPQEQEQQYVEQQAVHVATNILQQQQRHSGTGRSDDTESPHLSDEAAIAIFDDAISSIDKYKTNNERIEQYFTLYTILQRLSTHQINASIQRHMLNITHHPTHTNICTSNNVNTTAVDLRVDHSHHLPDDVMMNNTTSPLSANQVDGHHHDSGNDNENDDDDDDDNDEEDDEEEDQLANIFFPA
jgi:hypothetical protein